MVHMEAPMEVPTQARTAVTTVRTAAVTPAVTPAVTAAAIPAATRASTAAVITVGTAVDTSIRITVTTVQPDSYCQDRPPARQAALKMIIKTPGMVPVNQSQPGVALLEASEAHQCPTYYSPNAVCANAHTASPTNIWPKPPLMR